MEMTTASLGPGPTATDMPLPSTAAIRLAPLATVLIAIALRLLTRSGTLGPIIGAGALWIVELIAQIALWLGMAWLIKRSFSLAVLHYSAHRRRCAGLRVFEGGAKLLTDLFGVALFLGALFGIVGIVLDQPIGGLLATSGLFAAIIGFAIHGVISDVFSGLALHVERPFAIGDWIELASGMAGKITEANWRAVRLLTIEGRAVIVPNSALANSQFINVTAPERYFRLKRTICLDYSVPGERAVPILHAAMMATEGVRKDPAPIVLIDECNNRGVVYSLNFWVRDYPDQFPVSRQVVITALKFLDQAGLAPAYPKRDVALFEPGSRQIIRHIDLASVLSRIPLLSRLEPAIMSELADAGHLREFPPNAVIVSEGDAGDSLYVVVAGMLEASRKDAHGTAQTIGRLHPGEVFGEMSLLTGAPRSATVVAASPAMLVEISKDHLEPIFRSHPGVITQLAEIEAARLLSNHNAAQLSPAEHAEIEEVGFATFLRRKIFGFFGHPIISSGVSTSLALAA
jgi:small-conductance mechanosensitive channel/CRP-like cAMP-binding protein